MYSVEAQRVKKLSVEQVDKVADAADAIGYLINNSGDGDTPDDGTGTLVNVTDPLEDGGKIHSRTEN